MEVVIGVDVGTTHIKVVALSVTGRLVSVARAPTPLGRDEYGDCHDPDRIVETVCALIGEVISKASDNRVIVVGIGITSVGEEGVLLGPSGCAIYPAIAWYERRDSALTRAWRERVSDNEFRSVTGLHLDLGFTLFKWFWLRENQSEIWRAGSWWLGLGDYVAWRLCGARAMSYSHASRTGVMRIADQGWQENWVGEALANGVNSLPRLVGAGEVVGGLREDAGLDVPFRKGCGVVLTGLDHVVGSVGAGLGGQSGVLDSMGTAEAIVFRGLAVANEQLPDEIIADVNVGLDGRSRVGIGGLGSGSSVASIASAVCRERDWDLERLGGLGREVPPGARGLLYVPLGGGGPRAGGLLVNLHERHGGPDVYRAVLEGWSFTFSEYVRALAGDGARGDVVCIGGASSVGLWLEVKASILNAPIRVVQTPEAAAVGAAIFAGEGNGYRDLGTLVERHIVDVLPNEQWLEVYGERRNVWREWFRYGARVGGSVSE